MSNKDNNNELNTLEKQLEDINEWQKNAANPGYYVGSGKVPVPIKNLLKSPKIMIIIGILLAVYIVVCIGVTLYSGSYTITNDRVQLEDNILKFINRPTVAATNIDILQELNLGNKKYVLLSMNGGLGDAELTKGFNNKYKIESVSYGSGFFRDDIKKTNKGKYIILKGKNIDNKIAYSKILLDNKEYKIIIPQQEYFIAYCEVPTETERVLIESNSIKFYNSNNDDITDEMFKDLFK